MAIVEFPTASGGRVFVEIDDREFLAQLPSGPLPASGGGVPGVTDRLQRVAEATWEQSVAGLKDIVSGALNGLQDVRPVPDEVEVTFAVSLQGKAGIKVVETTGKAHLQVKAVWKKGRAVGEAEEQGEDAVESGASPE